MWIWRDKLGMRRFDRFEDLIEKYEDKTNL